MNRHHTHPAFLAPALRAAVLAALLTLGADLHAQAAPAAQPPRLTRDVAITLKASTLGVGLEVGKLLGSHAAVRVGGHAVSYNRGVAEDGDVSTYGLSLRNASGMLDLFPGRRGAFRVSVGVVGGTTSLTAGGREDLELADDGSGTPFAGTPFAGTLTERVTYPSARPYLGLGWGTPASRRGGIGFVTDFGVLYGKPRYTLVAAGPGAGAPEVQRAVARQREDLRGDVEKYGRFYPVVGVGLAYRF